MYFGECSTKPIYIRKLGSLTYDLKSIQYFYRGKISLYPRNYLQCSTLPELQHPKSRTFTLRQNGISVTTTYFSRISPGRNTSTPMLTALNHPVFRSWTHLPITARYGCKLRAGRRKHWQNSQNEVKFNFLFQVWIQLLPWSVTDKKHVYSGKQVYLVIGWVLSNTVLMQSAQQVTIKDVALWWKE